MDTQTHPFSAAVQGFRPLSELIPARWQTGTIAAPDGTHLHYLRTGGAKPALVLLHGFQGIGAMWLRTALALEADYDIVMPDFRGHGASGGVENGFSLELLIDDTAHLIRALKLENPAIIGHSMGGEVAGGLAAEYPDLARAVILVDPPLGNFAAMAATKPGDTLPPWMQMLFDTLKLLKSQPHTERMVTALRLFPPGTNISDEADYVSAVEAQAQFDMNTFGHASSMNYRIATPERIAQIACPILLITARPMMPGVDIAAKAAMFEANWRKGTHIHFANSGHFIPYDVFDAFISAVRDFLRENA